MDFPLPFCWASTLPRSLGGGWLVDVVETVLYNKVLWRNDLYSLPNNGIKK